MATLEWECLMVVADEIGVFMVAESAQSQTVCENFVRRSEKTDEEIVSGSNSAFNPLKAPA